MLHKGKDNVVQTRPVFYSYMRLASTISCENMIMNRKKSKAKNIFSVSKTGINVLQSIDNILFAQKLKVPATQLIIVDFQKLNKSLHLPEKTFQTLQNVNRVERLI